MQRQYAALTGIRGLAAIWVVVFHAYPLLTTLLPLPDRAHIPVIRDGFLAVDLFFVLSGFVLATGYHDRFDRGVRAGFLEFVLARFCRLFPLHWFCLAALVPLYLAAPHYTWGPGPFTVDALIASAALVQNWSAYTALAWNHPTWSLSAEWLASLLLPCLLIAIRRLPGHRTALAGAMAALLLLDGFLWHIRSTSLDLLGPDGLIRCLCEVASGVLMWKAVAAWPAERLGAGDTWATLGAAILLLVLTIPSLQGLAPFGFLALVFACVRPGRLTGMLGNRTIRFLGDVSFSLYLNHVVILGCFGTLSGRYHLNRSSLPLRLLLISAFPPLLLATAYLTWRFVEKPFQALGRSHARALSQTALQWLDRQRRMPHQPGILAAALAFWAMAMVATTLGETAGDLLAVGFHLGFGVSTAILMVVFIATLIAPVPTRYFDPVMQWIVLLSMCMAATTLWDFLSSAAGFHYLDGLILLLALAALLLTGWRWLLKRSAFGCDATHGADLLYWCAVLLVITVATAGADFLTRRCGLGYLGGGVVIVGALATVALAFACHKLPDGLVFWLVFLLIRPLGVVLSDGLTRPRAEGGLQFSAVFASLALAVVLGGLIVLMGRRCAGITLRIYAEPRATA